MCVATTVCAITSSQQQRQRHHGSPTGTPTPPSTLDFRCGVPVGEPWRRWRCCCDEGRAHTLVATHTQFQLQRSHSGGDTAETLPPPSEVCLCAGGGGGGCVRACNHTPHYSAELAGGLSIVFRGIEASNKQKRSKRMEESAGCTARAAMGDGVGAHPTAAPWLFKNARRGC